MQATARRPDFSERLEYIAATAPGRIWVAVFSCVALSPAFGYLALPFAAAIALASFRPRWRRTVLSTLALGVCALNFLPKQVGAYWPSAGAALLAAAWIGVLLLWSCRPRGGHPVLLLHLVAAAVLATICAVRTHSWMSGMTAATLCMLVPELLWRSSYWIKWRLRQSGGASIWQNLFTVLPFLGMGGVPFGKGPAYFAKHETLDSKTLAASQVQGVRLLALALAWRVADAALLWILWAIPTNWFPAWSLFSRAPLPSMETLMRIPASFALWQRWGGLYGELFHNIIALAFYGHTIVGTFCLMGFHIPRNTRSPLLATTLVDFWARYDFYFKELLMDFFFFPVFIRTSRIPVRWRTILATWSAAFAGNLYYHLALYVPVLASGDVRGYRSLTSVRLIYCALLASGLSVSFLRALKKPVTPKQPVPWMRRAAQAVLVATFFALLHVWNYGGAPIPLERRWHLWKTLVGMDTNIHAIQGRGRR